MISDQEATAAKHSLLFMCQTLMQIVNRGDAEMMVAACESLAVAFHDPAWLAPTEEWAASSRKKMN
jgi:hypothetical protein